MGCGANPNRFNVFERNDFREGNTVVNYNTAEGASYNFGGGYLLTSTSGGGAGGSSGYIVRVGVRADYHAAGCKYDRELMKTTVRAMERVQKIKEAREKRFWDKRMEGNPERERQRDLVEVKQGLDLIVSPLAQTEEQKVTERASQRVAEKA